MRISDWSSDVCSSDLVWTPDVYHGSPSLVTTFMATVVKTAGFAALLRLFSVAFGEAADVWAVTVALLSILTLFAGNITAVFQQNFKRLLAWTSVSHAGYLLMAVLAARTVASSAVLVYTDRTRKRLNSRH